MKANYHPPKPLRTYASRLNALRDAKEAELIKYGMEIGLRLMAIAVNQNHSIANDRLIQCFATARYLWETEFKDDAERAAEDMMQALDKKMGADWEDKADELCEKMKGESK